MIRYNDSIPGLHYVRAVSYLILGLLLQCLPHPLNSVFIGTTACTYNDRS
jgi:hypothetical protein